MKLKTILGKEAISYITSVAEVDESLEKDLKKLEGELGEALAKVTSLAALCPLDGRYSSVADNLREYFSEYALIKNRVYVEMSWLEWLIAEVQDEALVEGQIIYEANRNAIVSIYEDFSIADAMRVKDIEKVTNHDVKAVEYFIGEKLKAAGLSQLVSFVHIGCTSEDINNLAYALMIKKARNEVYIPALKALIEQLNIWVEKYKETPMLAKTHGQHATPTTLGKELKVYVKRLEELVNNLDQYDFGKFNGATGNYSAISVVFPNENWPELNKKFVEWLGLKYNPITTQIESHDNVYNMLNTIKHINLIILNFDLDMWMYISEEYLNQKVEAKEVGSSTMPHKVNPIKFENSEGNSYVSNGLIDGICEKMMRSRWQRDLSDSTVQRYIGEAMGMSLKLIEEATGGLKKCNANLEKIEEDLDAAWEVLAEPIQTMLRKYGKPDAYDELKALTRGKKITEDVIRDYIENLRVFSMADRDALLSLTPSSYTGLAEDIANL